MPEKAATGKERVASPQSECGCFNFEKLEHCNRLRGIELVASAVFENLATRLYRFVRVGLSQ